MLSHRFTIFIRCWILVLQREWILLVEPLIIGSRKTLLIVNKVLQGSHRQGPGSWVLIIGFWVLGPHRVSNPWSSNGPGSWVFIRSRILIPPIRSWIVDPHRVLGHQFPVHHLLIPYSCQWELKISYISCW